MSAPGIQAPNLHFDADDATEGSARAEFVQGLNNCFGRVQQAALSGMDTVPALAVLLSGARPWDDRDKQ
jgi:hypothetical protein